MKTGPAHTALLQRLGLEIRRLRHERALTIRELSSATGVSERFLVLVEAGESNVSVEKLEDIAHALGLRAWQLLQTASSDDRAVTPVLEGQLVALLGLRGAGKTTIGRRAAAELGVAFTELDSLVAEAAGIPLASIFEIHGTGYYRKLEREAIQSLLERRASGIVATGGSLVTEHASFDRLRAATITVWLKAKPEHHLERVVAQGDARPMANRQNAMQELKALLRARRALYERANHTIDTSQLGLSRSIEKLVKIARKTATSRSVRR
jgi:XRE family aerobic/anaerobic benzoate catabolism transcriptional regulator